MPVQQIRQGLRIMVKGFSVKMGEYRPLQKPSGSFVQANMDIDLWCHGGIRRRHRFKERRMLAHYCAEGQFSVKKSPEQIRAFWIMRLYFI